MVSLLTNCIQITHCHDPHPPIDQKQLIVLCHRFFIQFHVYIDIGSLLNGLHWHLMWLIYTENIIYLFRSVLRNAALTAVSTNILDIKFYCLTGNKTTQKILIPRRHKWGTLQINTQHLYFINWQHIVIFDWYFEVRNNTRKWLNMKYKNILQHWTLWPQEPACMETVHVLMCWCFRYYSYLKWGSHTQNVDNKLQK